MRSGILLKYKALGNSFVNVKDLKICVINTFLPKKAGTSKVINATIKVNSKDVSIAGSIAGIIMRNNTLTGFVVWIAASIRACGILRSD